MKHSRFFSSVAVATLSIALLAGCADQGFGDYVEDLQDGTQGAVDTQVQGEVQSTVQIVTQYLAQNPQTPDVSKVSGANSSNSKYIIKTVGSWQAFKVAGQDLATGYTYIYDSSTGKYTSSN